MREGAATAVVAANSVPELLTIRTLSVRAFDCKGTMLDAEVVAGDRLTGSIDQMLDNKDVEYLPVHNADRGCFHATVLRA